MESKALSKSVQKLNAQGLVERVGWAKNRHQASQACYLQKQSIYRNKEQQHKGNGKKIVHLLENSDAPNKEIEWWSTSRQARLL